MTEYQVNSIRCMHMHSLVRVTALSNQGCKTNTKRCSTHASKGSQRNPTRTPCSCSQCAEYIAVDTCATHTQQSNRCTRTSKASKRRKQMCTLHGRASRQRRVISLHMYMISDLHRAKNVLLMGISLNASPTDTLRAALSELATFHKIEHSSDVYIAAAIQFNNTTIKEQRVHSLRVKLGPPSKLPLHAVEEDQPTHYHLQSVENISFEELTIKPLRKSIPTPPADLNKKKVTPPSKNDTSSTYNSSFHDSLTTTSIAEHLDQCINNFNFNND